jgi:alpha-galactosidase
MAAAPAAITPEQAASWAYPQPGFSDREIAFTLCGALLGRVHLSGHLDQMSDAQRRLVADAVDVYKQVRADLPDALPFWPLGFPRWDDSWLALGMRTPAVTYLIVWHRGQVPGCQEEAGTGPTTVAGGDPASLAIPLPLLLAGGDGIAPETLYPRAGQPPVSWDAGRRELTVTLPDTPSACLIRIPRPGS